MKFDVADKMVAEAQTLPSNDADFESMTWTFSISRSALVGGGSYAVIPRSLWSEFVAEYIENKREFVERTASQPLPGETDA